MSSRKWRHPDGVGLKRLARTQAPMTPMEVMQWLTVTLGDDSYEALMPRGTEIEWYSPMTPQELAEDEEHKAANQERTEKWERETYDRLRVKFEEPEPITQERGTS